MYVYKHIHLGFEQQGFSQTYLYLAESSSLASDVEGMLTVAPISTLVAPGPTKSQVQTLSLLE